MNTDHASGLRKRLMSTPRPVDDAFSHLHEVHVETCATIHYTSEDAAHPIEHMFDQSAGTGSTQWRSARTNTTEVIVLEFDESQHIAQLVYEVEEASCERTQELRVEFSRDGGRSFRQVLVQEFTFSPNGANYECESLSLDLPDVTHLRLTVVPNKSGSGIASISSLRLFS